MVHLIMAYQEGVKKGWAQAFPLLKKGDEEKLARMYDAQVTSALSFLDGLEDAITKARTAIIRGDFLRAEALDSFALESSSKNYMEEAGKATAFWAALNPDKAVGWDGSDKLFPGIAQFAKTSSVARLTKLANDKPELRRILVPMLNKTSSPIRDLSPGSGSDSPEASLGRMLKYNKHSRDVMKGINRYLVGLEADGQVAVRKNQYPHTPDAFRVAQSLDDVGYSGSSFSEGPG